MKNKVLQNTLILTATAFVAIVLPFILVFTGILDDYAAGILSLAGVNAVMAISVNLISGITGQLSLGQAGFMAIGAYSTVFLTTQGGIPLPISVILAGIITAFFGFLIGFPTLKLEGDYLAIVTLAFGEIIRVVLVNLKQWTGGPNGMSFPTLLTLNSSVSVLSVTAVLVIIIVLVQNFIRSTYGRAILAVLEDAVAAIHQKRRLFDIRRTRRYGFNDRKRAFRLRAYAFAGSSAVFAKLPTFILSGHFDARYDFPTAGTFRHKRILVCQNFRKDKGFTHFGLGERSVEKESGCGGKII